MYYAPVTNWRMGRNGIYEILCGPPHKISVAFGVMWRFGCDTSWKTHGTASDAT
jgi:hypothetical protein